MRNFKTLSCAALAGLALVSCGKSAKISAVVADAPQSELIVKLLDVNKYKILDTVKTNAEGAFTYKLDIQKAQPEFVYLFHGDKKIASLLLQDGDKVKLTADTLGKYSVVGSSETEKLLDVERAESEFANSFASTTAKLDDLNPDSPQAAQVRRELAKMYITYYRDRVKYVMTNPYSLTVIPVLYQTVGENLPLFGQSTDAIHFMNAVDSLKTVYPESKYVKALEKEAQSRQSYLGIETRLSQAETIGFPDLELPDVSGTKVKLSSLTGKVVLLYFWTSESVDQKMLNLDMMKPVYEKYHGRGLDIYAVSLDVDKSLWASSVRHQSSPWTNVCDGKGTASPALTLYNVPSVPFVYVIKDGEIVGDAKISDEASLRKYLDSVL